MSAALQSTTPGSGSTPPDLSVVLVHYRTPELAREAIEALEAVIPEEVPGGAELLLVDNGNDEAGRQSFEELTAAGRVRLLTPGENLGYAGGVNLGVGEASGRWLVVMNPDVLVEPGCLSALRASLDAGAAVAGPRFFWDRGLRLRLPPTEEHGRRAELSRLFLGRKLFSVSLEHRFRRRWRRHAYRRWRAEQPVPDLHLSGALLAFPRSTWDRVGPFDEAYRLYFEEVDWLRRVAAAGLEPRHVPAARAVHLYDRSASAEVRSRTWYQESARRFRERYHGRPFTRLLGLLEKALGALAGPPGASLPEDLTDLGPGRPHLELEIPKVADTPGAPKAADTLADPSSGATPKVADTPGEADGESWWIEVSPSPWGAPAAGEPLTPDPSGRLVWSLPDEIWKRLDPGPYRLQLVDPQGREHQRYQFQREPNQP